MQQNFMMDRRRRKPSPVRRGLVIAVVEGSAAMVIYTILGVPFLTGYLLYLGASSFQVGMALAIPSFVNVAQIAAAFFMQKRTNRKFWFVLFAAGHRILWTLTGVIPFLFPQHLWIPIYLTLYTAAFFSNAMGAVIWTSLVSDMVPARVRGKYFGIRNTIMYGVVSLAFFVGGQLLDRFPGGSGFAFLFGISALFAILDIVLTMAYPNPLMEKSPESNGLKMVLGPFRNPIFLKAVLFVSVWLFLQGIAVPFFSYVMIDIMHVSYSWISFISIIQTISMMISYYVWGSLNARFPTRALLFWTFPLIALSCLVWPLVFVMPAVLALVIVHALLGIGMGGYNLLTFNFVIGDTPRAERPMFIGVFNAMAGLAGFIGPMLGGYLYEVAKLLPDWVEEIGIQTLTGMVLIALSVFVGPFVFKDRA